MESQNIWPIVFWLLSKFIHVVAGIRTLFFLMVEYFVVWIYHILFIHLSVDRHLDYFFFGYYK